uniref:Coiled-coil domain containing 125 n=1 Tax=Heterorhabditis bacteriophora TaxID=37862 RepID=A0A1I7WQP4_HETBA
MAELGDLLTVSKFKRWTWMSSIMLFLGGVQALRKRKPLSEILIHYSEIRARSIFHISVPKKPTVSFMDNTPGTSSAKKSTLDSLFGESSQEQKAEAVIVIFRNSIFKTSTTISSLFFIFRLLKDKRQFEEERNKVYTLNAKLSELCKGQEMVMKQDKWKVREEWNKLRAEKEIFKDDQKYIIESIEKEKASLEKSKGWHLGIPDSPNPGKYPAFPNSRKPVNPITRLFKIPRKPGNPVTRHFTPECQP